MHTVLRALARALTSAVYISAGWEVVRVPGGRVSKAGATLAKIRRVIPLPVEDEFIVRANVLSSLLPALLLQPASNLDSQLPSSPDHSSRPPSPDMHSGRLPTLRNADHNSCSS